MQNSDDLVILKILIVDLKKELDRLKQRVYCLEQQQQDDEDLPQENFVYLNQRKL